MNKKDFKNEIKSAYNNDAPDLLSKIKASCSEIEQVSNEYEIKMVESKKPLIFKRAIFSTCCVMLLFIGIIIGHFAINTKSIYSETSIYLDVNPSIEIQLDNDDNVYKCIAVNEDAEAILDNIDLDGVKLNTALNAIVGSLYSNGYLSSDSNSILVGLNNNDDKFLQSVTNEINNIFSKNNNINCSIIGQSFIPNDDMHKKAKECGVSVSKIHLVDKIIKDNRILTDDDIKDLSEMPIKDLNVMYSNNYKPEMNGDVIMGHPFGFIDRQTALNIVLEHLKLSIDSFAEVHVFEDFNRGEFGPKKMLYIVQVRVKNSNTIQSYLVDSVTGELIIK